MSATVPYDVETPDDATIVAKRTNEGKAGPFYRSVPFQIAVACGVSFTAPGMWDALGGLGAGGAAEPYAVSAANAILYALFAVVCVLAGAINNRIGLNWGLAIGAIGYPLYGAGLYTNNVTATTWFMLFGSAICGISAGFFWAAEAAIIIGYPSPRDRGFYLAVWQTAKASGPIVGGAINLGLNASSGSAGSVSSATYIVFIVIMCLGLPIALCLSPASKVWRKDRSPIIMQREATWGAEFRAVGKLMASRRMLMLYPAFFISYFFNGFMSTWLTQYFTVRSRAFSSFLYNFAGIISAFMIGYLLDTEMYHLHIPARALLFNKQPIRAQKHLHIKLRGMIAFTIIVLILTGTWIAAIVLQARIYARETKPAFDWFTPGFNQHWVLVWWWQFGGQAFQQFLYWVVGQYATDMGHLSRGVGLLRGVEALGQTVAWAMQSEGNANHFISIGLNFGILLASVPPTWLVLNKLEGSHEGLAAVAGGIGAAGGHEGLAAGGMAGLGDAGLAGPEQAEAEAKLSSESAERAQRS